MTRPRTREEATGVFDRDEVEALACPYSRVFCAFGREVEADFTEAYGDFPGRSVEEFNGRD